MPADNQLPGPILEAIGISSAKSVGEQPAILSNLALANQIFATNLQQQLAISQVQALNLIALAAVAKCVSLITREGGAAGEISEAMREVLKVIGEMRELSQKIALGALQPMPQAAPHS